MVTEQVPSSRTWQTIAKRWHHSITKGYEVKCEWTRHEMPQRDSREPIHKPTDSSYKKALNEPGLLQGAGANGHQSGPKDATPEPWWRERGSGECSPSGEWEQLSRRGGLAVGKAFLHRGTELSRLEHGHQDGRRAGGTSDRGRWVPRTQLFTYILTIRSYYRYNKRPEDIPINAIMDAGTTKTNHTSSISRLRANQLLS